MNLLTNLVATMALVQGPAGGASAQMSVGATVVRAEPAPTLMVQGRTIAIRNVAGVTVSATGGAMRRTGGGTAVVAADGAGRLIVTITY